MEACEHVAWPVAYLGEEAELSRWRFQSTSLSSVEKAVMVSWPPRWRRNGAQKAWMRWVRSKQMEYASR
jgi:hypothetical protein